MRATHIRQLNECADALPAITITCLCLVWWASPDPTVGPRLAMGDFPDRSGVVGDRLPHLFPLALLPLPLLVF
jgi:hypothetical protein